MNEYTAVEVIKYFRETYGIQKSRIREYVDRRNYVAALLYYKFRYTEEELGALFLIDRSSINHAKDRPYILMAHENEQFLSNCKELIKKFPYILPYNDRTSVPQRIYSVTISLTKEEHDLLKVYASARDQYTRTAARDLVVSNLKKINRYG